MSKTFSMLSLSALRSENQQSTSVLDSLVPWASWSAEKQSGGSGEMWYLDVEWFFCRNLRIQPLSRIKEGLIKNIFCDSCHEDTN